MLCSPLLAEPRDSKLCPKPARLENLHPQQVVQHKDVYVCLCHQRSDVARAVWHDSEM